MDLSTTPLCGRGAGDDDDGGGCGEGRSTAIHSASADGRTDGRTDGAKENLS